MKEAKHFRPQRIRMKRDENKELEQFKMEQVEM